MKAEFEKIAGYKVSQEDYDKIIEPMYMATNLDKFEFIETLNKDRFVLCTLEDYIEEMKKLAAHIRKTCDHYTDYDAENRLFEICEIIRDNFRPYKGFIVNRKYTLEHLGECRGCVYPASVEFYFEDYTTMLKVNLFENMK